MSESTVLVYEIMYRDERFISAAGDHDHIYRTTSNRSMAAFMAENDCHGKPSEEHVPRALFNRWLREGKVQS